MKEYQEQHARLEHCEALIKPLLVRDHSVQCKVFGSVNVRRSQGSNREASRLVLPTYRFRLSRRSRNGLGLVHRWKKQHKGKSLSKPGVQEYSEFGNRRRLAFPEVQQDPCLQTNEPRSGFTLGKPRDIASARITYWVACGKFLNPGR